VRRPRSVKGLDCGCFPTRGPGAPRRPEVLRLILTIDRQRDHQRNAAPGRTPGSRCCCRCATRRVGAHRTGAPVGDRAGRRAYVVGAMAGRPRAHARPGVSRSQRLPYAPLPRDGPALLPGDGAAWARAGCPISDLSDDALAWRENGIGPVMDPARVEAFVEPVAAPLAGRSQTGAPAGVPVAEAPAACPVLDEEPLVSCVLRAPDSPELAGARRPALRDQHWWQRELIVLEPADADTHAAAGSRPGTEVVVPPATPTSGRPMPWQAAKGPLIRDRDATPWYGRPTGCSSRSRAPLDQAPSAGRALGCSATTRAPAWPARSTPDLARVA